MGTTLLPKGVTSKLTQLRRRFWWGSSQETQKLCLIGWQKIAAPKHCGGLGFRDPELVNISLVFKLVWGFLTDENSICSPLLRAKYLRSKSFWDLKKPANISHIWRSMLECRSALKSGCCWFIGRNSKVHIWNDPWVPSIPGFRVEGKENSHSLATWVHELLMTDTTQWNIPLLQQLFDDYEVQAIYRIVVCRENQEDTLMWLPMSTGTYTAKSMYKQLTLLQPSSSSPSSRNSNFSLSKLWMLRGISPRIILFLWRALHRGIAVGSIMGKINGASELCNSCNTSIETIEHALVHCYHAKTVWENSTTHLPPGFDHLSLQDFLSNFLQRGDLDQVRLAAAAILWMIWKARNNRIFNNKSTRTFVIIGQAQRMFKNPPLLQSSFANVSDHLIPPTTYPSHWLPPPLGFFKINVDGACMEGISADGFIARDNQDVGIWLSH